jgi:hypothetical protein
MPAQIQTAYLAVFLFIIYASILRFARLAYKELQSVDISRMRPETAKLQKQFSKLLFVQVSI